MDGDVDFLREALRVLVGGIMDAEVSAQIGAQHGERSPERIIYRNRTWDTPVGAMELHILGPPDDFATTATAATPTSGTSGQRWLCVLDTLHFYRSFPEPVTLTTKLHLDASRYAPAPPRVKGPHQPTLKELLDVPSPPWIIASVPWCDGTIRTVKFT